jgi:hypothetical protein
MDVVLGEHRGMRPLEQLSGLNRQRENALDDGESCGANRWRANPKTPRLECFGSR